MDPDIGGSTSSSLTGHRKAASSPEMGSCAPLLVRAARSGRTGTLPTLDPSVTKLLQSPKFRYIPCSPLRPPGGRWGGTGALVGAPAALGIVGGFVGVGGGFWVVYRRFRDL